MKKRTQNHIRHHKIKKLIDAMPKNTNEAKHLLANELQCSLDKINRWYRDSSTTITTSDQWLLMQFFKLNSLNDLYEPAELSAAFTKPVKAH